MGSGERSLPCLIWFDQEVCNSSLICGLWAVGCGCGRLWPVASNTFITKILYILIDRMYDHKQR